MVQSMLKGKGLEDRLIPRFLCLGRREREGQEGNKGCGEKVLHDEDGGASGGIGESCEDDPASQ